MILCEISTGNCYLSNLHLFCYILTLFLNMNLKAAYWIKNGKCLTMLILYLFNCTSL